MTCPCAGDPNTVRRSQRGGLTLTAPGEIRSMASETALILLAIVRRERQSLGGFARIDHL